MPPLLKIEQGIPKGFPGYSQGEYHAQTSVIFVVFCGYLSGVIGFSEQVFFLEMLMKGHSPF